MAKLVREIMNQDVFSLRPDESAEQALDWIVALGITGAPVVDQGRRVVGHASFRDLLVRRNGPLVSDRMTTPVEVVSPPTPIEDAGRRMARLGVHRLVVTEETKVVGVVSALDVMSALLGVPVVHPPAFPLFDRTLGISWTDEAELAIDALERAPDGPGLFVLIDSAPLRRDWIAWIEAAPNVRTRLDELLSAPQSDVLLGRILAGKLRFRAAAVANEGDQRRALEKLKEAARRWPGSPFECGTAHGVGKPPAHANT
jgi:CBS domain-containing protein